MATIASLNIALSADSAKLKRDLDRAGKQSKTWAAKQKATFRSVGKSMGGMRSALVGVGAALGVGKLLDNADALGKNAKAAGINVEAYQRLQHGFAQAGISAGGFTKGQKTLNKIFADAGDGMGTAVDALAMVGLSYEDLAAMKPEERMLAVARGLDSIEDSGIRAAVAAELMGKEMGTVTLDADQILKDGEGIAVVTQEAADKSARMNDAMNQLSTTLMNLTTNVLVPMIAKIAPLIESIAQFAQDNPMMASALAGLAALGVAITVAGGPITLIVAAIAAAILVFQNWDTILLKINTFLEDTFGINLGAIAEKLAPVIDALKAIGGVYFAGLQAVWDIIKAIFTGDWEGLKATFYDIFSGIGGFITGALKAALNGGVSLIESMLNSVLGTIISAVNKLPFVDMPTQSIALPRFATGGWVSGPGTGTSDSIPALLSNGEFVVNAKAAKNNAKFLENINSGGNTISSGGSTGSGEDSLSAGDEFVISLKDSFTQALKDGDWKSFLGSVMDSFTSTVIDSFVDGLFAPLEDVISGAMDALMASISKGASGGGDWVSSAISWVGGLFGAADGGIVPTTPFSKSYADSVPTMLQPGELVVPKDQVGNFMGGGSGGGQTFNINVTGDVSRLTRKEVVKMMPEIAAGTNMVNRENNVRG
tara:strand:+ start:3733 stop:5691 length:1959 start_codon:yes stop_codon:yes gene_type:complete